MSTIVEVQIADETSEPVIVAYGAVCCMEVRTSEGSRKVTTIPLNFYYYLDRQCGGGSGNFVHCAAIIVAGYLTDVLLLLLLLFSSLLSCSRVC